MGRREQRSRSPFILESQFRKNKKYSYGTFERSRQTGSGVSLRAKRTRITRIKRIYGKRLERRQRIDIQDDRRSASR